MYDLEDKRNDWLAQELRREGIVRNYQQTGSRINAASKLSREHELDCEAREIKQNHARAHAAYNRRPNRNENLGQSGRPAKKRFPVIGAIIIAWIAFEAVIAVISTVLNW